MTRDPRDLQAGLANAFGHREYPGDDHVAHVRERCLGYEGNEARDWLRGKSWSDLIEDGMGIEHRDYVHFLRPEGWLYYLPALATFALDLDHPAEMDETLLARLAWQPQELAALLTPAEHGAIVDLLEYLVEAGGCGSIDAAGPPSSSDRETFTGFRLESYTARLPSDAA